MANAGDIEMENREISRKKAARRMML